MGESDLDRMGQRPQEVDLSSIFVYVTSIMDVMEALVKGTVDDSVYIYDNHVVKGSTGLGTQTLNTGVNPGNRLIWSVYGMEVETLTQINSISGQVNDICDIKDMGSYLAGTIKADTIPGTYEYTVEYQLESQLMTLSTTQTLIVESAQSPVQGVQS